MKPNIVLITVDQMRRDCMGAAGHPYVETPNLDAMCRQGLRFTNAYTATPSCIAARCALLTGMEQRHHGRVGYEDGIDWNYEHTLPGELTKAGYQTQCVGKMHVSPARNRCGFENVVLHDGYLHHTRKQDFAAKAVYEGTDDYLHWLRQRKPGADLMDNGLECNSWVARPWAYEEELHPTFWCASESIDFLRRRDTTKPFFLHTSFVRPHSPLDPPQYYLDMYLDKNIPAPALGDWEDRADANRDGMMADCKWGIIPEPALRRARCAYYGLITQIDHQIGRMMQAFGEYGLLNNTVFLFTSDHGDMLGDHNFFRKALAYEGSAGIPMVLYDPGDLLGLDRGGTCGKLVELRDIMPTLLSIAGAQIPETVDGTSVLSAGKREYLHGEHELGPYSSHFIVTETDKYIWYSQSGREQYFDLKADPEEMHDAIGDADCQNRADYLRSLLIRELTGREEGYTDGKTLIPGRTPLDTLENRIK